MRSLIQSPIICPNQNTSKCVNSEVQNTNDCVVTCTPTCCQKLCGAVNQRRSAKQTELFSSEHMNMLPPTKRVQYTNICALVNI